MTELEEQVLQDQVRKIADHMDFGVISMLLVDSCAWTKVELEHWMPDATEEEVLAWANNNCNHRFMHYSNNFIFEDAHDALVFKLTWS